MNCPKCNSDIFIKNGVIKGLQRYRCKNCGNNFTVEKKSSAIEIDKKRIALILYLEGMRVSSIAQKLGVSHVSVIKWIQKYGNNLVQLRNQTKETSSAVITVKEPEKDVDNNETLMNISTAD